MDFIERLFGVSPDNGDGSTEVLWLAILAIAIVTFVYFRVRRRRTRMRARRIR
jgi:hypothetical protein